MSGDATMEVRVALLETRVHDMREAFDAFRLNDVTTKHEIMAEIKKFNNLLWLGKGGVAVLIVMGAFVIWVWEQIRPFVLSKI